MMKYIIKCNSETGCTINISREELLPEPNAFHEHVLLWHHPHSSTGDG